MTLPPHWLASHAFRVWCFRRSTAIHDGTGRLGPLRRLLADVPCYLLEHL